MSRLFLLALPVLLQLSLSIPAQQPKPSPAAQPSVTSPQGPPVADEDVVRITANLVQVDAVVTDKNGKPVTDLQWEEIHILDDGDPQKNTHF